MGLTVSHTCWDGGYISFNIWRCKLAEVAGIPLELMEGYLRTDVNHNDMYHFDMAQKLLDSELKDQVIPAWNPDGIDVTGYAKMLARFLLTMKPYLPIKWEALRDDPLIVLLNHSDCDGIIEHKDCKPLADRIEELLPLLPDGDGGGHIWDWKETTQQFIDGLRCASEKQEDVKFS